MRKIKFSLLAVISSVILLSNISFSQVGDKYSYSDDDYNCLADKKWSMVFEIGTLLKNLDSSLFKSFTLAGKYHFNKKNGLRLSISTNASLTNSDSKENNFSSSHSSHTEGFNLETSLQMIHYINPDSKIKVYVGLGPYFDYTHSYNEYSDSYGYISSSRTSNNWSLGLAGSFGVEYFILDNISLMGEYYCIGKYTKTLSSNFSYYNNSTYEEYNTKGWEFELNRMRIGLSVYF